MTLRHPYNALILCTEAVQFHRHRRHDDGMILAPFRCRNPSKKSHDDLMNVNTYTIAYVILRCLKNRTENRRQINRTASGTNVIKHKR